VIENIGTFLLIKLISLCLLVLVCTYSLGEYFFCFSYGECICLFSFKRFNPIDQFEEEKREDISNFYLKKSFEIQIEIYGVGCHF